MRITVEKAALAIFLALGATATTHAQDRGFQFALIGDMPYSKIQEQGVSAQTAG